MLPPHPIVHPAIILTGTSTAGKSTLAKKLAQETGARRVSADGMRVRLYRDNDYGPAARFYADQPCQKKYFESTNPEVRWEHLRRQSRKLWMAMYMQFVCGYRISPGPVVFEGVNLLPNIVSEDLRGIPIVAVVCDDEETILARLAEKPRWGTTPNLQALEARQIAREQAPRYRELTLAAGGHVFSSVEEAMPHCLKILSGAGAS